MASGHRRIEPGPRVVVVHYRVFERLDLHGQRADDIRATRGYVTANPRGSRKDMSPRRRIPLATVRGDSDATTRDHSFIARTARVADRSTRRRVRVARRRDGTR